jgi:hypothetical protein
VIRAKRVSGLRPVLESVLTGFGKYSIAEDATPLPPPDQANADALVHIAPRSPALTGPSR